MFLILVISISVLFHAMSGCCLGAYILQQHTTFYVSNHCGEKASCNTLDYYADRANTMDSNTEFIFLDGHYVLNKSITLSNLSKIMLKLCENCHKSAVIFCMQGVGFKFEYIQGLTIAGITLHNCSRMHSNMALNFIQSGLLHTALYMYYVSNLSMVEVTVQHTLGYGVIFFMLSGSSTVNGCCFQNSFSSRNDIAAGNAMLAFTDCTDTKSRSAQVEVTNSSFLFGKSEDYYTATGLAILVRCSGISVKIEHVTFKGNEAKKNSNNGREVERISGGNLAIGFYNISTHNSVWITKCNFYNGQAFYGAGMYLTYYANSLEKCGNTVIVEDSVFSNNTAYENGGAVHVRFFQGLSYGNSCVERGKTTLELNYCTFENNIVRTGKDAGIGVAIDNAYADNSQASSYKFILYSIFLKHCVFVNNNNTPNEDGIRSSGSAVLYASQQNGDLLIQDCLFSSNGVTALAAFRSKLYFSGNVTIYNNIGYEGGGM